MTDADETARAFKTAWFAKAARKALIDDDELCEAIAEVRKGQADDLGGGVFKKRLDKNRHRSIIVAKGRRYWVYAYLFAKQDRANIESDELKAFRKLADLYAAKTDVEIGKELETKELVEICK
ncbi:type II toxin-antitoxin system RelE/ParE family toxin [Rhodopila globiformis]|uniref:Addiction module toxin RelE n=1 Tax=Rhodopila globiformis TaxID=1071 RepID=A0A2S6NHV4_RHOGL|nr:type II toxin-antitoxin system RelE/ParE family toxin [Rhodopila globiformis]PPQ34139.1 addiction module toxin RelE [Rhodopila globiformis]